MLKIDFSRIGPKRPSGASLRLPSAPETSETAQSLTLPAPDRA